jgi:CBS domain-containing protein
VKENTVATTVAEIMARDPQTVQADAPVREAAQRMRDADTGDVVVLEGGRLVGIVTDRDIAVRVVAEGGSADTPVRDACTADPTTITPDTRIEQAVALMRDRAIRRLPVVEGDRPVGVVSLGDLAIERDEDSVLADISAAAENN